MQYRTLTHKGGRILVASYMKIFFVLFFTILVGCVKVSATCSVKDIDKENLHNSLEECADNPTLNISKDF